jgi:outer membrane biosynthesis protein TonB
MSRKSLEGRHRSSILVQLGATAGVLVLPPLMMSAGVALFGAQTEDRLQISSEQTIASAVSKSSALIPLSSRPREVSKSVDRPPLHDEPAASASQSTTAISASTAMTAEAVAAANVEPAVEADEPSENTKTEAAAEPVPFLGPIPVTLVVVRKEPEPEPAEPEEEPTPGSTPEPTPPAPPVASIEPVIPHAAPKAAPAHVAHPRNKPDREEARAPHRIAEKRPHAPVAAPHSPHSSATAAHRPTAGASVAAKAKPRLQHRADLEN